MDNFETKKGVSDKSSGSILWVCGVMLGMVIFLVFHAYGTMKVVDAQAERIDKLDMKLNQALGDLTRVCQQSKQPDTHPVKEAADICSSTNCWIDGSWVLRDGNWEWQDGHWKTEPNPVAGTATTKPRTTTIKVKRVPRK